MKDSKVHFHSVFTSNSMPYLCTIPAVLRGRGAHGMGWTWVSSAPFRWHSTRRLRQQQRSSCSREGCSPRSTHQVSAVPCPGWGLPIQDTKISKHVQRTASARAEGTFTSGKRQGRSAVTAAYNCTETELDSDSQQKNKGLWHQGKFWWDKRKIFAWWERLITERDCPERLWYLLPMRYSKLEWMIWFWY